jgi:hypothetical protein
MLLNGRMTLVDFLFTCRCKHAHAENTTKPLSYSQQRKHIATWHGIDHKHASHNMQSHNKKCEPRHCTLKVNVRKKEEYLTDASKKASQQHDKRVSTLN